MLLDLLNLLPPKVDAAPGLVAAAGLALGTGFWVMGVKFSRPIITLLTVLLGAAIGLKMPKWFNWNVSGAGPAVGAAFILGITGFALHRMWLGISLGLVLALWATLAIWTRMHGNETWTWPTWNETSTTCSYAKETWQSVPPSMSRYIIMAALASIVSGLVACILWPRFTGALNWSAVGVTLIAIAGIGGLSRTTHRDVLARLPQRTPVQLATLAVMLLIGFGIQFKMLSPRKKAVAADLDKKDDPQ